MGIRLTVTKNGASYRFKAALNNTSTSGTQGCYLGFTGYYYAFDRDQSNDGYGTSFTLNSSDSKQFTLSESNRTVGLYPDNTMVEAKDYTIKNDNGNDETISVSASKWILIAETSYFTAIDAAFNSSNQVTQDISNLIRNGRFIRNADNGQGVWYGYALPADFSNVDYSKLDKLSESEGEFYLGMNPWIGQLGSSGQADGFASAYGKYGAGEIPTGKSGLLRQTIKVSKPGTYRLRAKVLYYPDENSSASDSKCYLFLHNNGTEIPVLSSEKKTESETYSEKEKFDNIVSAQQKVLGSLDNGAGSSYFRMNTAAAQFFAENEGYTLSISVTITQDYIDENKDRDGNVNLGFGIAKTTTEGYLFIDDVEMEYSGNYEFGIDAYETNKDQVKVYENKIGRRFNLRRQFTLGTWNSLVLPVNLTAGHVRNVFGQDAELLELAGLNPDRQTQVLFNEIPLDGSYKEPVIKAGGFYLVKVTDEPDEAVGTKYTFDIAKPDDNAESSYIKESEEYDGPVYHFADVTSDALNDNGLIVTKTMKGDTYGIPNGYTLTATGSYYYNKEKQGQPGDYVMSGGNMYHLDKEWKSLWGTCWKLRYTNSQEKAMSLSMNIGGNEATGIKVIEGGIIDSANVEVARGVYNLSGQKVSEGTSLEGLARGIYVVNGKKVVLK